MKNNKTNIEVIKTAETLGTEAFKAGKKSAPATDSALMVLIGKNDGHAMNIMNAWERAWHCANLAKV